MKSAIVKRLRKIVGPSEQQLERQTVLYGLMLAKLNRDKNRLGKLADAEFSGFSQWGEDGIIDWLVEKLPGIPRTFVEFGVGNYRESNTRLLLHLRNWRGLVMDGSQEHIDDILRQDVCWRFDLIAKCAFINREAVNDLIASSGIAGKIGLLSIDIDGNDYWVWQAIDAVNPAVVVCEYNAVFGDVRRISVPYQADFQRTHAHHSNLYFGASLPALRELADRKGYAFLGTNSNGCNAFFVRQDVAPPVVNSIADIASFPSSLRESRDAEGRLTFARGSERLAIIKHLPVFDFESGSVRPLGDLGDLYSPQWREAQ